ncbi:MAG: AMP-binding protein [Thermodesulfobacteriota bacterium]
MAVTRQQKMEFARSKARLAAGGLRAFLRFCAAEKRRGTLWKNLQGAFSGAIEDMSWSDLLEEKAAEIPDKTFLRYREESYTYRQMNENADRVASYLVSLGADNRKGMGIFMRNSPRFLDLYFAAQKCGMYVVPINSELKGDGLLYIINHSDIEFLAVDAELLPEIAELPGKMEHIREVIVDDVEEEAKDYKIPKGYRKLSTAYDFPAKRPPMRYGKDDMVLIMYTSGTTGRPKGVVYTASRTKVKLLGIVGGITMKPDDVYYTALALCHGNAMLLTVTQSLHMGATVVLARKFSASRFWDDIRRYDVTVFNTIGSIIPILMKQPESVKDRCHRVRYVLSAACPTDLWVPFEERFGVKLFEGYGAVDSGGKGIVNLGTAPPGSLGKPLGKPGSCRIVDEKGNDVPPGVPGELIFKVSDKKSSIRYYKNEEASEKKMRGGWMYTGDLVKRDEDGYLYFVGRDTESMRKGGENVSAYEVEHVIRQHPGVEEVAVYAVPSELAEDEIMAAVKPAAGVTVDPAALRSYLAGKLAKFAVPRYIRIVSEFPMTQTHRVIKKELERQGVTTDTYDAQAK